MRKILTDVAAAILVLVIFAAMLVKVCGALDFKGFEPIGAQQYYSARTSSLSSHTVSGYGFGWSVTAIGGTADFVVKHSTCQENPNINVSSTIYLLNGQNVKGEVKSMVLNPLILITRIDTPGCTVYVDIDYIKPRYPGEF